VYETATVVSVSCSDLVKYGFRSFVVKADRVIARSVAVLIKSIYMLTLQSLWTVDNHFLSFSVD